MKIGLWVGLFVAFVGGCAGGRGAAPARAEAPRAASVAPASARERGARDAEAAIKRKVDEAEAQLARAARQAASAQRLPKGTEVARSAKAKRKAPKVVEPRPKIDLFGAQAQEAQRSFEDIERALLDVGLAQMIAVARVYADKDYAAVQRILTQTHRLEAVSALATGLVASYRAVLGESRDPKALEHYADAILKRRAGGEATLDEAKGYVECLVSADRAAVRAHYERLAQALYPADAQATVIARVDVTFAEVDRNVGASPPQSDAAAAALSAVPLEGKAHVALEAARALARADLKGAMRAAVDLAPDDALKSALTAMI
jgi:hypothetical protein